MWRDLPIDLISRSPIARWAPVPLRLIVGYGFMEHGFAKLARGPDAFPAILQALEPTLTAFNGMADDPS
jgi:putative oxidoreductase